MFWVISAVDLPQGQKVSGPIAVDVPPGTTTTEIVVTNHTRFGLNHSDPPDVSIPGSKHAAGWDFAGRSVVRVTALRQHRPLTQLAAPRAAFHAGRRDHPTPNSGSSQRFGGRFAARREARGPIVCRSPLRRPCSAGGLSLYSVCARPATPGPGLAGALVACGLMLAELLIAPYVRYSHAARRLEPSAGK
jgi:hypothetical protein